MPEGGASTLDLRDGAAGSNWTSCLAVHGVAPEAYHTVHGPLRARSSPHRLWGRAREEGRC
jgi:hypothetical protein